MDKTALNISSSSSHLQVGLICHLLPPTLPNPSPGCGERGGCDVDTWSLEDGGDGVVSGAELPGGVASLGAKLPGGAVSSGAELPSGATGSGARYPVARPDQERIHVHAKTAYTDVHKFILLSSH